jgi:hypothetical protein
MLGAKTAVRSSWPNSCEAVPAAGSSVWDACVVSLVVR